VFIEEKVIAFDLSRKKGRNGRKQTLNTCSFCKVRFKLFLFLLSAQIKREKATRN